MEDIRQRIEADIAEAETAEQLQAVRVRYLGSRGVVTTLAKNVDFGSMAPEERRSFGARFNALKQFAAEALDRAAEGHARAPAAAAAAFDVTVPGSGRGAAALHPITLIRMELEEIFAGMGFRTLTGFEVEDEHYNFDALNIPGDHPAREMQDTYWLTNGQLLRTHTSASQTRAMRQHGAPLRAIFPGRCFRYENPDARHDTSFYQLEGLMVERDASVATLIATMRTLLSQVFGRDVTVRLRPGYFPFVEPGFELDIQCLICGGRRCPTCKTGWLELMPCGMVHPTVLENGGVDPAEYTGFAFGLGMTRLAMMKYGIPDIRLFNSGDLRFLEQFPASA